MTARRLWSRPRRRGSRRGPNFPRSSCCRRRSASISPPFWPSATRATPGAIGSPWPEGDFRPSRPDSREQRRRRCQVPHLFSAHKCSFRPSPTPRLWVGLSPRGRGNLAGHWAFLRTRGTIPARAGEPTARSTSWTTGRDHPRAGGGTYINVTRAKCNTGPSPRGRGNLQASPPFRECRGTIPARAGEPAIGAEAEVLHRGPSPRGRGNHSKVLDPHDRDGTIPARAGEPTTAAASSSCWSDHPRAGGGTLIEPEARRFYAGPSPRGRGNRSRCDDAVSRSGTIPARAGEPSAWRCWGRSRRDHPRAGGGTR